MPTSTSSKISVGTAATALVTALAAFITVHAVSAVLDPKTLFMGILVKIIAVVALALHRRHQVASLAHDGGRLLAWLGWSMGFFCFGLAWLGPATPPVLVVAAVLACSATAVGWNGVFFAGLARMAPPGRMAALSGGAQVFTFAGGMIGPLLFGELVRVSGSYPLAYALFALLPAAMGTVMWRAHRGNA